MRASFWAGKRILITGNTGFKGSWLSALLLSFGAEVFGYAKDDGNPEILFRSAGLAGDVETERRDIRDIESLRSTLLRSRCEIVIHMAAQALVLDSYENPVETFGVNVLGTATVLEAVRDSATIRTCLIVTSDKCYDLTDRIWGYRENEPLGGRDPYSASKGCAEIVTASFAASFFESKQAVSILSARAGNVIGGGDWSRNRLVPDAIRAMRAGIPLVIRSPHAIRPWQHVLEPLSGYLALIEASYGDDPPSGAWNFGPSSESEQTVSWVLSRLSEASDGKLRWEIDVSPVYESNILRLDSSKARVAFGWKSRLKIDSALRQTYDWYANEGIGVAPRSLMEGDIAAYLTREELE